jgi:hypothetical protein
MFLSRQEIHVLLGAQLMYMSVPFHRTVKTGWQDWNPVIRRLFDRLVQERDGHFGRPEHDPPGEAAVLSPLEVAFSDEEVGGCCKAITSCLAECADSPTDLDLHLGTREREEVERLLAKFLALSTPKPRAE